MHLGIAILAFAGVATLLVQSPFAPAMLNWLSAGAYNWLLVLAGFTAAGWLANKFAMSGSSQAMQYLGLGIYVVAEAILFVPILFIAAFFTDPGVLPSAVLLTGVVFGGLTVISFVSKKDFSFLGRVIQLASLAAMGTILVSILFGFTLGSLFAAAMVLLASGAILYQTSNVLRHYPIGSHVAASLALFAAVALLFYYILMLLMRMRR
jgi:FtsH-binding integral membrane protein